MIDIEIATGPQFSTFAVDNGAVLDIISLSNEGASERGLLVASGDKTTHRRVEPGYYLFQASLPSGETVSREVHLEPDQPMPVRIELFSRQSPHEWLSWQQLNSDLTRYEGPGLANPYGPSPLEHGLSGETEPAADVHLKTLAISSGPDREPSELYDPVLDFVSGAEVFDRFMDAGIEAWGLASDRRFQLFGWPGEALGDTSGLFDQRLSKRYYALIGYESGWRELVLLPIPWSQQHQEAPIELVAIKGGRPGVDRARLTVRDTALGTMLSFLAKDSVSQARLFVDGLLNDPAWEEILYFKKSNPLAAAGAGYLLVQTESDLVDKPWHLWLENLCNWFPWLPDGGVLMSMLRFSHRAEGEGSSAVVEMIDETMQRGIPYYRLGLKHLYQLGAMLHESDDEPAEVRDRMAAYCSLLTPLVQAVNPTEPFVSFRSMPPVPARG